MFNRPRRREYTNIIDWTHIRWECKKCGRENGTMCFVCPCSRVPKGEPSSNDAPSDNGMEKEED